MKSYHLISVTYAGATNTQSSRAKISSLRFPNDTITVSLDYSYNNVKDQAIDLLNSIGFKIAGYGYDEKKGIYILMTEVFEPLKEHKKSLQLSEKRKGWHKDHYNYNKAESWERTPAKRKTPARNYSKR
jgi:hypothetical protein